MNMYYANAVIGSQLKALKKADGKRFIMGQFEYELKAGGSWFAPQFYIRRRDKYAYRGRFHEVGHIDAAHMRNADDVFKSAVEYIRGGNIK